MIKEADIENWFSYHAPKSEQIANYTAIRDAAKFFAKVVLENTPAGADQTAAVRKIREAVMTANAAIACHKPEKCCGGECGCK